MKYFGQAYNIEVGNSTSPQNYGDRVNLKFFKGGWQRILIVGESGQGKSAHAKDIIVKVSKVRKVCVFSLKGEWENHITKYSRYNPNKQRMTDVKVISEFAVKISQFNNSADFSALGFSKDSSSYLQKIINEGYKYYKDDVDKFEQILKELPAKAEHLEEFNIKYRLDLLMAMNHFTKQNLLNHWIFIKDMFWYGKNDDRPIYDFKKEWLNNNHLIINITSNSNKARALCGHILQKIREIPYKTYPLFVFEEMRVLFPNVAEDYLPSSIVQIYDILTMGRKEGIAILGITQKTDQIFQLGLDHFYTFILGKTDEVFKGFSLQTLKWNPSAKGGIGYRVLLIYNKDGTWARYEPDIACCRV